MEIFCWLSHCLCGGGNEEVIYNQSNCSRMMQRLEKSFEAHILLLLCCTTSFDKEGKHLSE